MQGDVAATAVRDHQLAQLATDRAADEGVVLEHGNGLTDVHGSPSRGGWIIRFEEIEPSVEIGERPRRVEDSHARRRLIGLGRVGFLVAPVDVARAAMYA